MTHMFDCFNDIIRLQTGESLLETLEQFVQQNELPGAWISGLGGASQVTLGFYDLDKKEYQWQTFDGLREVVSLTGNIAFDENGKPAFHLHGVFGDRQFQTVGGHVKDLVAGATLELFIHRTCKPLHRKPDEQTGLQLLA
ncbi:MAG: PPC domain-containing DNA-binding protein [Candidatus Saccharimonadales bacterium]